MAILKLSFTSLSLCIFLTSFLFQFCESQFIASDQIKLWSENVQNKMPKPIMNKLSPLTKKDCDFFSNKISRHDDKFKADSNFCALAQLACSSVFNASKPVVNEYNAHIKKTYDIGAAASSLHQITKTYRDEDPFSFFRLSILKNGNLVHLPDLKESFPHRSFLPPQIASKISLTSTKEITKIFPGSNPKMLESFETTLSYCNAESIKGEMKSCPRSLEEMISFSKFVFGGKKLIALTSQSTKGSNSELKIKNMKNFSADKIVACHEVFLPFAAYFCHSLSSTNLYKVDFAEPETGAPVNSMLAICHMDTSSWPADHVAFQILKFSPGQGEACHWFTQLDLAWIAEGESV